MDTPREQAGDQPGESAQDHRHSVIKPPCRRFTILDGMILIAGVSLWFVQTRRLLGDFAYEQLRVQPSVASNGLNTSFAVSFFVLSFYWLVVMLTPTYMILRLRQPRPSLPNLLWQPGMLTSLVVLFCLSIELFCFLVSYLIHSILYLSLNPLFRGPGPPYVPVLLVACGWLAAKLTGRFRPEHGWIEQLGRSLGLGWMAAGILLYVLICAL
jgi:hypothetical protein